MKDLTPRCPHCSNLTLVGTLAGKCVAVCTYCDDGFAVSGATLEQLMSQPAQVITRTQYDKATEDALNHINKIAQGKQDELLNADSRLPKDRTTWTPQQQQDSLNMASQRMLYAGVLQGSASYRDVLGQMLGLPKTTITSAPVPASVPTTAPVEKSVDKATPVSPKEASTTAPKAAKTSKAKAASTK